MAENRLDFNKEPRKTAIAGASQFLMAFHIVMHGLVRPCAKKREILRLHFFFPFGKVWVRVKNREIFRYFAMDNRNPLSARHLQISL